MDLLKYIFCITKLSKLKTINKIKTTDYVDCSSKTQKKESLILNLFCIVSINN